MKTTLNESSVFPNPLKQFNLWFTEANTENLLLANTMTLATATREGKPSARIVLLKQVDDRGFIFYTSYNSRKGGELQSNPHAALVFYWPSLERQVRVEGGVARVSSEESDMYFQSRPRESQISAVVSFQSKIVAGREELEREWETLNERLIDLPVTRPPHWGGYCLKPESVEFWQSRESRLHDRILYRRQKDHSWKIVRLSP